MRINTPEENLKIERDGQIAFEERNALLKDWAAQYGYTIVDGVLEIGLTADEMAKLSHVKPDHVSGKFSPSVKFLIAQRENGTQVKAIIYVRNDIGSNEFAADVFTPAFHGGHGTNHDFNRGEMEGTLKEAVQRPAYPSRTPSS